MSQFKVRADVGDLVRAARQQRGLSQEALAYQLGLEQSDISRIELGKRKPSPEMARRLAVALELSEDEFLQT